MFVTTAKTFRLRKQRVKMKLSSIMQTESSYGGKEAICLPLSRLTNIVLKKTSVTIFCTNAKGRLLKCWKSVYVLNKNAIILSAVWTSNQ